MTKRGREQDRETGIQKTKKERDKERERERKRAGTSDRDAEGTRVRERRENKKTPVPAPIIDHIGGSSCERLQCALYSASRGKAQLLYGAMPLKKEKVAPGASNRSSSLTNS